MPATHLLDPLGSLLQTPFAIYTLNVPPGQPLPRPAPSYTLVH